MSSATILLTASGPNDPLLIRTLGSARRVAGSWPEIVVVSERSFAPGDALSLTLRNPRISVFEGSLTEALVGVSTDYGVLVKPGVEIDERAIVALDAVFAEPTVDLAYGDGSTRSRPAWSPYFFLSAPYADDLIAFRPSALSGIRPGSSVAHVRHVLAHGEGNSDSPPGLIEAALERHARSTHAQKQLNGLTLIIPTCGAVGRDAGSHRALILDLLDSLSPLHDCIAEVLVVADTSTPQGVLMALRDFPRVRVILYDKPFNFSDKCNVGALAALSDALMFLNDDMISLTSDWPEVVLRYLADSAVGAVGGLLVSPDGLVQCAGHANTPVPHLFGVGRDPDDPANKLTVGSVREVGGLSGACFGVRRDDYLKVGGMYTAFPSSYNDVDLGFKLIAERLNLVYTPEFRFVHHESASRDPVVNETDLELLRTRWGRFLEHDPFPPPPF